MTDARAAGWRSRVKVAVASALGAVVVRLLGWTWRMAVEGREALAVALRIVQDIERTLPALAAGAGRARA